MGVGQLGAALWIIGISGAVWASETWVTTALLVIGILALAILDRHKRGYWERLGIPTVPGSLPLIGHALDMMNMNEMGHEQFNKAIKAHKDSKVCGRYFLWSPWLCVNDAETTKNISIKDFDHFVDRRPQSVSEYSKDVYSNDFLTIAEGNHWKHIRSVLSPTFSSGKMKHMYPMIMTKADALTARIHQESSKGNSTFDMMHYVGRFTVDVIASTAFGFEINAINAENVEFVKKLDEAFHIIFGSLWGFIVFIIAPLFPRLSNALDVSFWKPFRYHKQALEKSIQERIQSEQLGAHGDFLDLILEAKASAKEDISDNTVIASSVIFLIAGFDTVKTTLVILLHLLAANPKEQQNLRQEIQDIVDEHGTLTYQSVMEAKYLEACVSETQRLYPAIGAGVERMCTKNYVVPGTQQLIEKGIIVQIPTWSLQLDDRYWNNPHIFNPDNFMPPNKQNIVTGSFLPFGIGPRNCIAQRFALMEVKILTARLVQEFQLSLSPGREELLIEKGPITRLGDTMPLILTPLREE